MLYFVRHGQSQANLDKTFAGGQIDSPLTNRGREQAVNTAKVILDSGITFDKIISSPMSRAFETAQIIQSCLGDIEIVTDERMAEYDMGSLSGQSYSVMKTDTFVPVHDGENPDMLKERVLSFLEEVRKQQKNILVVSHGFVFRMIKTIKNDSDIDSFYRLSDLENAELAQI